MTKTRKLSLKILAFVMITISISFLLSSTLLDNEEIFAATENDGGYYLRNVDVKVEVNDKREYLVTETLDVHYTEKRHGIIRTLPHSSSAESFTISDVAVTGAPAAISEEIDGKTNMKNTVIKIGDPEVEVKGDVQYVLTYKRICYDDSLTDGDYIYFDIFGSGWNCEARNVHSEITFPSGAELLDYTVTSGDEGTKNNDISKVYVKGNKVEISSTEAVAPGQAITLNAKFAEGTFANVPDKYYPFEVENSTTEIEVTGEKNYLITQNLIINFNNDTKIVTLNLLSGLEKYAVVVSDILLDGKEYSSKNTSSVTIHGNSEKPRVVEISYKLNPTMREDINFALIDHSWEVAVKNLSAKITLPFAPTRYDVAFGLPNADKSDEYKVNQDGNILTFSAKNVNPSEHADIMIEMDNSYFARRLSPWVIAAIITAAAVLLAVISTYIKFGRDKKLVPVNTTRPPENLSSAEVGYIINKTANSTDIGSLIPYWANEGHIRIEAQDKEKFTLTLLSPLDDKHKDFEKDLFLSLFDGKTSVDSQNIGTKYITGIAKAQEALPNLFIGDKSLMDATSSKVRALMSFLCGIPLIILGACLMVDGNRNSLLGLLLGVVFYLGGLLGYFFMYEYELNYHKLSTVTRGVLCVLIAVYMLIAIFGTALAMNIYRGNDLIYLPIISVVYLSWLICILISRRSEYGTTILEEVLGFKHYLLQTKPTAFEREHSSVEEYTYSVLSYAQALGLTTEYCNKFKSYATNPPSWYRYRGTDLVQNYALLFLLTRTTGADIINKATANNYNSTNRDSSSGSGGFSGGGGGGGGSSW